MTDNPNRKVVCVQYETGKTKTIKKNGRNKTQSPLTRRGFTGGSTFALLAASSCMAQGQHD